MACASVKALAGVEGGALVRTTRQRRAKRPLGAYFRVNHRDLVAMHAAITEVGVLYVSGNVHSGWDRVGRTDEIELINDNVWAGTPSRSSPTTSRVSGSRIRGARRWGHHGFGHVTYEDWLKNGTDAWVAGSPSRSNSTRSSTSSSVFGGTVRAKAYSYPDLRPHVISIGNDGLLDPHGNIGTTPALVQEIVHSDIPRITKLEEKADRPVCARRPRLGRLGAAARRRLSPADARAECYPLAFIWHSDSGARSRTCSKAANQRRPEGFLDVARTSCWTASTTHWSRSRGLSAGAHCGPR